MRTLILFILLPLLLSGCSGVSSKTQNIVSFTDILVAETPDVGITLPSRKAINGFNIDLLKINASMKPLSEKPKFDKASLPDQVSSEPLIADGKMFVICADGSLHAYDTNDHKLLWKLNLLQSKTKTRLYGGGIAYDDGKLYITHGSQYLIVVNSKTGRIITSRSFGDILVKKPLIHKGLIYVLTLNNQLFAVTKQGFTLIWDHAGTPEKLTYGINHASINLDYKERLFVTYSSGQIFLLNSRDGQPIWEYDLANEQSMPGLFPVNVIGDPILDKNYAYVADSIGKLYKFDLEKDKKIWDRNISDIQTMNMVGGALLITTNGRQAAAIDSTNGKVIWVTDIVNDISQVRKQEKENRAIAEYNRKQQEKALQKQQESKKPKGRIGSFFADLKNRIGKSSDSKPKLKEPKVYYNRNSVKPINFVAAITANDQYQLYTAKGKVYYLSVKDGRLIDQRDLSKKLNYVTFYDDVTLSSGKAIYFSK